MCFASFYVYHPFHGKTFLILIRKQVDPYSLIIIDEGVSVVDGGAICVA